VPDIATWHPQIVHFVIALAFVGIGARVVSLIPLGPRFSFVNGMATSLIVMAAIAGVFAVTSGDDAHGPVERVPGARAAVQDHEHKGEAARTALIVLALIELAAMAAAAAKPKLAVGVRVLASVAGIVTAYYVYEAGEHGGTLVYNYAGGIGLRSGDTADVGRLLVAGLYHRAAAQRAAGAKEEAARLTEELVRQMPGDTTVRFLGIESLIKDRNQPRAALDSLRAMPIADANTRLRSRRDYLVADAYVAAGVPDSARIVLEALKARTPAGPGQERVQQAIDKLPKS
jgi:uncharacterized membrane protein